MPLSTFFTSEEAGDSGAGLLPLPHAVHEILNGLESSLKAVSFNPGQDFEIVAVSFDPKDTPEIAAAKKTAYLQRYGRRQHRQRLAFSDGR